MSTPHVASTHLLCAKGVALLGNLAQLSSNLLAQVGDLVWVTGGSRGQEKGAVRLRRGTCH